MVNPGRRYILSIISKSSNVQTDISTSASLNVPKVFFEATESPVIPGIGLIPVVFALLLYAVS